MVGGGGPGERIKSQEQGSTREAGPNGTFCPSAMAEYLAAHGPITVTINMKLLQVGAGQEWGGGAPRGGGPRLSSSAFCSNTRRV